MTLNDIINFSFPLQKNSITILKRINSVIEIKENYRGIKGKIVEFCNYTFSFQIITDVLTHFAKCHKIFEQKQIKDIK